jgi:hypothetical protein
METLAKKILIQRFAYRSKLLATEQDKALSRKAQVSLETAFALIVTILLLLGATYIFVWMNKTMVERQKSYKAGTDYTIDDSHPERKLHIFP